jgi:hypothetical protein
VVVVGQEITETRSSNDEIARVWSLARLLDILRDTGHVSWSGLSLSILRAENGLVLEPFLMKTLVDRQHKW